MATIPFATIEDVEARLGYELTADEAAKTQTFLEDFSLTIQLAFDRAGKNIDLIDPNVLKMVVARRAAEMVLTDDLLPGQTSFSETIADRSISGSVSASATKSATLELTGNEILLLGLQRGRSIYSIRMRSTL